MEYILLLALNTADFATGILAAKIKKQPIVSRKAKQGILRKCAEWLAVFVAFVCEHFAGGIIGVELPAALVVVGWLCVCELISIVENLAKCGLKIPAKLLNILKNQVEEDKEK